MLLRQDIAGSETGDTERAYDHCRKNSTRDLPNQETIEMTHGGLRPPGTADNGITLINTALEASGQFADYHQCRGAWTGNI